MMPRSTTVPPTFCAWRSAPKNWRRRSESWFSSRPTWRCRVTVWPFSRRKTMSASPGLRPRMTTSCAETGRASAIAGSDTTTRSIRLGIETMVDAPATTSISSGSISRAGTCCGGTSLSAGALAAADGSDGKASVAAMAMSGALSLEIICCVSWIRSVGSRSARSSASWSLRLRRIGERVALGVLPADHQDVPRLPFPGVRLGRGGRRRCRLLRCH